MGPRADLELVEHRKIPCPCRESNPSSTAGSPSLYRPLLRSGVPTTVAMSIICLLGRDAV
jgi:hypothetical protein